MKKTAPLSKRPAAPRAQGQARPQGRSRRERLGAIDVGTNSIRCIIVEAEGDGNYRVLDDEKATVRLGEGLLEKGTISPPAWERAREALLRMRKILDGQGVTKISAVATSAVRSAANGPAFVAKMAQETGVSIKVIPT